MSGAAEMRASAALRRIARRACRELTWRAMLPLIVASPFSMRSGETS